MVRYAVANTPYFCTLFNSHSLVATIPCPFFVGRVKRQRNPTHLLGYGYGSYVATQAIATLRERSDCSAFTQCPAGIRLRSTTQPTI